MTRRKNKTTEKFNEKYFIESLFCIQNKQAITVPFIFNEIQRDFFRNRTHRDIILKARQEGFSSLILAIFFLDCMTLKNINAVVVSHEKASTERLLARAKFYLETLPKGFKPEMEYLSRNEMFFKETKSRFWIGTAGSKTFGRGDTIHRLHLSEIAFWEDTALVTGLLEAVPDNGWVVIESTANGVDNYFHWLWGSVKAGEKDFKSHFYSWQRNPDYTQPVRGVFVLSQQEKELKEKYKLSDGQLQWRRWKIRNMDDPSKFPQEYPCDDLEAFLTTGRLYFNADKLKQLYDTRKPGIKGELEFELGPKGKNYVVFEPNPHGILEVFEKPKENRVYRIGADVAEGIENAIKEHDYSVASVKDGMTWEQVACLRCHLEPDQFGDYLDKLGRYYNNAKLAVEDNNHGLTTLTVLNREKHYPNLYMREVLDERTRKITKKVGWHTDLKTRPVLLDEQSLAIREDHARLNSDITIREHLAFIKKSSGKAEAQSGAFDDCVIADAIATQMCKLFPAYDPTIDWATKQFPVIRQKYKESLRRQNEPSIWKRKDFVGGKKY